MTFGHYIGRFKALYVSIRNLDLANDTVKVNNSDLDMTGAGNRYRCGHKDHYEVFQSE